MIILKDYGRSGERSCMKIMGCSGIIPQEMWVRAEEPQDLEKGVKKLRASSRIWLAGLITRWAAGHLLWICNW